MKVQHIFILTLCFWALGSCASKQEEHSDSEKAPLTNEFHLSQEKYKVLNFGVQKLIEKNMLQTVEISGSIEVPPQNEAIVTAIVGANIHSILVIEGQKISKGQILAYLSHPELITLQSNYITVKNELEFMKSSYERQKKLYDENVGSGKDLQEVESKYLAKKGELKGLEYKLKMLGMNSSAIAEGNIYEKVPVKAPIDGYIQKVRVKTAQFVQPEKEMFEIINLEHIHADLMVFEKDVHLVEEGQRILFKTESLSGKELSAIIYSVGKSFEDQPKAVHIHADIENKEGLLLPGMYISGKIIVDEHIGRVLPSEAVVNESGKNYIFQSLGKEDDEWVFKAVEVEVVLRNDSFTEVRLPPAMLDSEFADDKGYYLMAEWKKEDSEHSHTH